MPDPTHVHLTGGFEKGRLYQITYTAVGAPVLGLSMAALRDVCTERGIVLIFDEVFVLTGGGPGTATQYIVQYIYETAFAGQVHILGLAAAASILVGGVLMLLTLAQLGLTARAKQ